MTGFLARISARRPWITIGVWLALVVVAAGITQNLLDSATTTEFRLSGSAESERAAKLLEDRFRGPEPITEIVIVQSESLTVDDPVFRQKVESVSEGILSLGGRVVTFVQNYYQGSDESLVSMDRKTTIMPLVMTGRLEEAESNIESVLHVVEEMDASDDFRVLITGASSISYENNELATHDLEQGEQVGVPVAMLILLVLFGALVAALAPIGLAVVSIIIALGIAALVGQVFELVFFVTLMITMIGLAVGIDYSLFIISRFREEMNRGLSTLEAVQRAGDTAGRTVLFSGVTVVIALCGLLIVPFPFLQSLGLGAILVVIVALVATLTLLPAALALLGPKVDALPMRFTSFALLTLVLVMLVGAAIFLPSLRIATIVLTALALVLLLTIVFALPGLRSLIPAIPYFTRSQDGGSNEQEEDGFWERTTRIVTKFPIISIVAIGAPMIVVTYFYFDIRTGINGVDAFPEGAETREAFFVLDEEFSFGIVNPIEIVIDGDVNDPQVMAAIESLETSLMDSPDFPLPPALMVNPAGDLALMTVVIPGEPRRQEAVDIVSELRDNHIRSAFDGVPATVLVGGVSATAADVYAIVNRYTPIVFAFVLGFSFIVLMLVFRSIVIPVKAVFMNLLSVGAAYGLMVLVFQKGVGADLLGFQHAEVIDVWVPLFLFTVLFGLSMDYHVFLLSRIRERFDQTGDNAEAVAYGLRETAGIITGAALIMVAVFGAFASGKTTINQQVGFGLAVAILLDATLVRSVLVPASMEVLGRGNWYLPSWLVWLPDLRVEPED